MVNKSVNLNDYYYTKTQIDTLLNETSSSEQEDVLTEDEFASFVTELCNTILG